MYTAIYMSSYRHICVLMLPCVNILLNMCPHTSCSVGLSLVTVGKIDTFPHDLRILRNSWCQSNGKGPLSS